MPQVPLQTTQQVFGQIHPAYDGAQASPDAFGAPVGAAAQRVGGALQQASDAASNAAIQQQAFNNEASVNDAFANSFSSKVRDITSGFMQLQGKNAVDGYAQAAQDLNTARLDTRASLNNPAAQRMFDQISMRYVTMEQEAMKRQADQQQLRYNEQASNGLVKSFQQQAADRFNDPINFNRMVNSVALERARYGQTTGQPDFAIDSQIASDKSQMWIDRLRMLAQKDAVSAYSMLQNGETWNTPDGQIQHTDVMQQVAPSQRAALVDELQKGADAVTAHSNAMSFLSGAQMPGVPQLQTVVEQLESKGDSGAIGPYVPGQGTAKGSMQVMDATNGNPGFGVTPAKDDSPEERARVGGDYIARMYTLFGSADKALAAYNAGPGRLQAAVTNYGSDWLAHMPPKAQEYVANGLALLGQSGGGGAASSPSPFVPATPGAIGAVTGNPIGGVSNPGIGLDAAKMEADLASRAEAARQWGNQADPNNPRYGDEMYAEVMRLGNAQINTVRTSQAAAGETLTNMIGQGQIPSMADLMANPDAKNAYSQLSQKGQIEVQNMIAKPPVKLTTANLPLYQQLVGEQNTNPEAFMKEDIVGSYGTKLPVDVLKELINGQAAIAKGGVAQSQKTINFSGAWGNVADMARSANVTNAGDVSQLKGAFIVQLQAYQRDNGKPADAPAQRKIMASLLAPGEQSGAGWFGSSASMPAYQSPDPDKWSPSTPATNAKGWTLHVDGGGRRAYVSPDGKQFELVSK